MTDPELSVVVPFFQEEHCAREVVKELCEALESQPLPWEAILVDDGSADATLARLEEAAEGRTRCRVLPLGSNLGQGGALYAGFCQARGRLIGMMDGDGQNVPADLLRLAPLLEDCDLAVGVRTPRHDDALRRAISRWANTFRGRALGDRLTDAGCAVKLFRREMLPAFFPLRMLNPFMPALAVAAGFKVAEAPVSHRPRRGGRSKYGIGAMVFRPAADFLRVWMAARRLRSAPLSDKARSACSNP